MSETWPDLSEYGVHIAPANFSPPNQYRLTSYCADGKPCGTPEDGADSYCADCPNAPDTDATLSDYTSLHCGDTPPSKYHVGINGVWCDVYDVLVAYGVTNPADAHAIKKMLMPGKRGSKDANQDRAEAIQSLQRAQELEQ